MNVSIFLGKNTLERSMYTERRGQKVEIVIFIQQTLELSHIFLKSKFISLEIKKKILDLKILKC